MICQFAQSCGFSIPVLNNIPVRPALLFEVGETQCFDVLQGGRLPWKYNQAEQGCRKLCDFMHIIACAAFADNEVKILANASREFLCIVAC
jgi:hypothetical protein